MRLETLQTFDQKKRQNSECDTRQEEHPFIIVALLILVSAAEIETLLLLLEFYSKCSQCIRSLTTVKKGAVFHNHSFKKLAQILRLYSSLFSGQPTLIKMNPCQFNDQKWQLSSQQSQVGLLQLPRGPHALQFTRSGKSHITWRKLYISFNRTIFVICGKTSFWVHHTQSD